MQEQPPYYLDSRQVWTIAVLCTLLHMGFTGARVAISLNAIRMGASEWVVGVLVAGFSLIPAFTSLKMGRALDRLRPVPALVVAAAAQILGTLVPAVFSGLWALLAASLLVGTASNVLYLAV